MAKKKQTAKGKKKRAPAPRQPTTALARREPAPMEVIDVTAASTRTIGTGTLIGELGIVELKLTRKEEATLAESVPLPKVLVKPDSRGVPYVSHTQYTALFNRAFGRTGWAIVPVSKPAQVDKSVVVDYVLFVHRQPVAHAQGEQEYHPNNRDQTFGDAVESTVASGLRRCAKRLGIWSELWDPQWGAAFRRDHCKRVRVKVKRDGEAGIGYAWRRSDQEPLWNETTQRDEPKRQAEDNRQRTTADQTITKEQAQRLGRIIKASDRTVPEVKAWFRLRFRVNSTTELTRKDYDFAVRCIQAPGALPVPREPGEDG